MAPLIFKHSRLAKVQNSAVNRSVDLAAQHSEAVGVAAQYVLEHGCFESGSEDLYAWHHAVLVPVLVQYRYRHRYMHSQIWPS
jgi:hypothetical protein